MKVCNAGSGAAFQKQGHEGLPGSTALLAGVVKRRGAVVGLPVDFDPSVLDAGPGGVYGRYRLLVDALHHEETHGGERVLKRLESIKETYLLESAGLAGPVSGDGVYVGASSHQRLAHGRIAVRAGGVQGCAT